MLNHYEIHAGRRIVSTRSGSNAQQTLIDYLRSLGCRNDEIVRLGVDAIAWRGARYSAVQVNVDSGSGS
jgi:hypothetical protein